MIERERPKGSLKLKNNAPVLDNVDLRILGALQTDARMTYVDIGKRLGKAHSTIFDRIRRMERQGIIRKYTIIVDAEKAGAKSITALVTVYTDPKKAENVAEKLAESPEVLEVYTSLSEELIIMAKIVAENQESLHAFIANSIAPLHGVLRIRTSIVTRKVKETCFSIIDHSGKVNTYKKNT